MFFLMLTVKPKIPKIHHASRCEWNFHLSHGGLIGKHRCRFFQGHLPFEGDDPTVIMRKVQNVSVHRCFVESEWAGASPLCAEFAKLLLTKTAKKRPTAAEVLQHQFITGELPAEPEPELALVPPPLQEPTIVPASALEPVLVPVAPESEAEPETPAPAPALAAGATEAEAAEAAAAAAGESVSAPEQDLNAATGPERWESGAAEVAALQMELEGLRAAQQVRAQELGELLRRRHTDIIARVIAEVVGWRDVDPAGVSVERNRDTEWHQVFILSSKAGRVVRTCPQFPGTITAGMLRPLIDQLTRRWSTFPRGLALSWQTKQTHRRLRLLPASARRCLEPVLEASWCHSFSTAGHLGRRTWRTAQQW